MNILDQIVAQRKITLEAEKQNLSISELEKKAYETPKPLSFETALSEPKGVSVIAEVKKASPSKGIIRPDFHPVEIAKAYEKAKVEALSVLTEQHYFQGNSKYLTDIHQKVNLPLLRKDFIIDPYQIYEAKGMGASAILLIVAILSDQQLHDYQTVAKDLGLSCLVETHDEEEVKRAVQSGANIIGVNNRNLKTFDVSLSTTEKLVPLMTPDTILVSESGIQTNQDIKYLETLGVKAVLVGETFMREKNIEEAVKRLRYGD